MAYLWVYTLLLGTAIMLLGERFDRLASRVTALLSGWKLIVLPVLVLGAVRIALSSQFPSTHNLTWDWYNHANYLCVFILGAMFARNSSIWKQMDTLRIHALGIAFASWGALIIWFSLADSVETASYFRRCACACGWCTCCVHGVRLLPCAALRIATSIMTVRL
ncbi:hypothetical protein LP420_33530 [Massilia sp. B-10]|nr:hypothetical protein LP420_33530 [Massilia sp. B-10]